MTGGSAERPAVLVVHLTDQTAASPRIVSRSAQSTARSAAGGLNISGAVVSVLNNCVGLCFERLPAGIFDDEPEQHESKIAVDRLRVGRYSSGSEQIAC